MGRRILSVYSSVKIDFRNMFAIGGVRFLNSLNSLCGAFTAKKPLHDPSCLGIGYKEWEEGKWPLQWRPKTISLVASFKNLVAMWQEQPLISSFIYKEPNFKNFTGENRTFHMLQPKIFHKKIWS